MGTSGIGNRLVLTGGVALNAIGNMRLLEHFDEAWFARTQQRKARLHLWVPPTPGDAGVTIGAAWLFAQLAGAPRGAPDDARVLLRHAAIARRYRDRTQTPAISLRNTSAISRRLTSATPSPT